MVPGCQHGLRPAGCSGSCVVGVVVRVGPHAAIWDGPLGVVMWVGRWVLWCRSCLSCIQGTVVPSMHIRRGLAVCIRRGRS
eukprot:12917897-Prorocentrum_lima.AAC.1